jgi:transcriptional regulator with XRE-family HTH domain
MAKAKTAKQKNTPLNLDLQWLGQRIKIARLLSGYSQSQNFKNTVFPDYTVSLYYQWEIGKRKPGDEALKRISEFCKINYDWLKTGDGDPFKGIKISSKEKNLKKAMIAYEMINKKFELEKQRAKISRELSEKLFTFSAAIPSEEKKDVSMAINIDLFEKIIQALTEIYNAASIAIPAKKFAQYAAHMYATIVEHETDPKLQLKMVKIVAATYRQMINS